MRKDPDVLRAVVVKLRDSDERPWIACTMQATSWEIIDPGEWDRWRSELRLEDVA